MKYRALNENDGFFKWLIGLVIFIVVCIYFGINPNAIVDQVQSFFLAHPEIFQFLQSSWSHVASVWTNNVLPYFLWLGYKEIAIWNITLGWLGTHTSF